MKDEEHDELWDLLGKARKPEVSSFFAANVMRKVREEAAKPGGFEAFALWLRRKWFIPAAAAACALAVFAMLPERLPVQPSEDSLDEMALAVAETSDIHLIVELDTLVAADNNAVWLEADPSSLF
ncbi:MAG: hypothetical protein RL088_2384 [Verrucomicrobiota bacterium]